MPSMSSRVPGLAVLWLVPALALAAPKSPKPTAVPAPAPKAAPANTPNLSAVPPAEAVSKLRQLYENLEYEQVIAAAASVITRKDLSLDQTLEIYRLQGSAKAVVEDQIEAEKPFRLLVRARPEFELPKDTSPKILAIFRKVQSEERALAEQLRSVERGRIIAQLKLLDELPTEGKGGRPLAFNVRVKDPSGAVASVRIPYRRQGDPTYSVLALQRDEAGEWRGSIPGEFTASQIPYTLEYFLETTDGDGPLLTQGTAEAPLKAAIAAGSVETKAFKPVSRQVFFISLGATIVAGLVSGVFGIFENVEQANYRRKSAMNPADGAELAASNQLGQFYAGGVNVSLGFLAGLAVLTGVMIPLTDFTGP